MRPVRPVRAVGAVGAMGRMGSVGSVRTVGPVGPVGAVLLNSEIACRSMLASRSSAGQGMSTASRHHEKRADCSCLAPGDFPFFAGKEVLNPLLESG
ncbi:MAG: hypothetical protein ISR64_01040 [Deltaproteobacteria bacterium]|nr:hypothetical protein [Deltaproteobacteria bacterium]